MNKKFGLYDTMSMKEELPVVGFDDNFVTELKEHRIIKGYTEGHPEADVMIDIIEDINNAIKKLTADQLREAAKVTDLRNKFNQLIPKIKSFETLPDGEIQQINNQLSEINEKFALILEKISERRNQKTAIDEKYKNIRPDDYQLN